MLAAGATLKSQYSKLFHVICVAHLLYPSAVKITSHFEDVDQLIIKDKSETVSIKTKQAEFAPLVAHINMVIQDGEAG